MSMTHLGTSQVKGWKIPEIYGHLSRMLMGEMLSSNSEINDLCQPEANTLH